jgi:hypothetical protein
MPSQPIEDPFRDTQTPPHEPSAQAKPKTMGGAKPQQQKQFDDYSDYGSINLEPMSPKIPSEDMQETDQSSQAASASRAEKTDLDLEIERYQREIEEKQRRQHASSPAPQGPSYQPPSDQQSRPYDVYEQADSQEEKAQNYQQPDQTEDSGAAGEQPLYFTSVNTDRQRKKMKRPVNPKIRPQNNFLSKFFNKDKP